MSLDFETNQRNAQRAAKANEFLYQTARQKYVRHFSTYRKDISQSLCLGHVLRVNPELDDAPETVARSFKRGFTLASTATAHEAGLRDDALDTPSVAAYVWCRELNRLARALYNSKTSLFPNPNHDFWKSVYLKNALGDYAFNQIWNAASLQAGNIYAALIEEIESTKKAIPPWSVMELKKISFYDCEYVFELARIHGTVGSSGYGTTPTLSKRMVM